jgi:CrcB protein
VTPQTHSPTSPSARRRPPLDPRLLLAVFTGGALGTLARAALSEALPHDATSWPWATFIVNLVGAFVLGYVIARLEDHERPTYQRPFFGTGLCGGLTTFSTLQLELVRMADAGAVALALAYATASIAAGLTAVWLGTHLVRRARLTR